MGRMVDRRKEILVTRADHDHDEIGGEGEVDQIEDADHHIGGSGALHVGDKVDELEDEFDEQRREADDQAEKKRRHEPAAVEDDRLYPALDSVHAVATPGGKAGAENSQPGALPQSTRAIAERASRQP